MKISMQGGSGEAEGGTLLFENPTMDPAASQTRPGSHPHGFAPGVVHPTHLVYNLTFGNPIQGLDPELPLAERTMDVSVQQNVALMEGGWL